MAISISLLAERIRRPVGLRRSLVGALAVVAIAAGAFALSRSSLPHARAIRVTGARHLSRAEVVELAGVSRATNLVWLDEGAIERRLETEPWIAEAGVGIAFPATIRLAIVERVPVAFATDGVARVLVAADGTTLGSATRTRGLPRIELPSSTTVDTRPPPGGATGVEPVDGVRASPRGAALAMGAMSPQVREGIVSARVGPGGTLELELRGGVTVHYGSTLQLAAKTDALERILAWASATGARLSEVNVAAPTAPAVTFAP